MIECQIYDAMYLVINVSHSIHMQHDNLLRLFKSNYCCFRRPVKKLFSFFSLLCPPQEQSSLYALENKHALFSEAFVYRDCTAELSRERGSRKVWRGGNGNGERERCFIWDSEWWRSPFCSLPVPRNPETSSKKPLSYSCHGRIGVTTFK